MARLVRRRGNSHKTSMCPAVGASSMRYEVRYEAASCRECRGLSGAYFRPLASRAPSGLAVGTDVRQTCRNMHAEQMHAAASPRTATCRLRDAARSVGGGESGGYVSPQARRRVLAPACACSCGPRRPRNHHDPARAPGLCPLGAAAPWAGDASAGRAGRACAGPDAGV